MDKPSRRWSRLTVYQSSEPSLLGGLRDWRTWLAAVALLTVAALYAGACAAWAGPLGRLLAAPAAG